MARKTGHSGTTSKEEAPQEEEPQPAPHEREWPRPWQGPFLRSLGLIPDVSSAVRAAGIGRTTVYRWRDDDEAFRDAWDEALEIARDNIQRVAYNWATTGLPVRSRRTRTVRKVKDGVVIEETTETVETESAERYGPLMIFWLKAWYPDRYRWSERVEATGAEGGPIRVESLDAIDGQIQKLSEELMLRARVSGEAIPDEQARDRALADPIPDE